MAEGAQVAVAPPEVPLAEFAPSITVIDNDQRIQVACTAAANRMSWQITTSKLRCFLEDYMDEVKASGEKPPLADIKKVVEIASIIQDMSFKGFEGGKKASSTDSSDFEKYTHGALKSVAEGFAKGMGSPASEKEATIKRLGRKRDSVEIDAKPVEEAAPAEFPP